jgi:hypothetical protein
MDRNDLTLLRMKPIFKALAVEGYRRGVVRPVGDSR